MTTTRCALIAAALTILSVGFARSISGTVVAPEAKGVMVIACYPSNAGCDEDRSGYTTITQAGGSAPYRIDGLGPGKYFVIAWLDRDGNGEMSEAELAVYSRGGEPVLVSPPATGIDFFFRQAGPPPATVTPAPANALVGSWFFGSVPAVGYYNPVTGSWAPPTGGGVRYQFRADGSYTYNLLIQSSVFGCTTSAFVYTEGRYHLEGQVLMLVPTLSRLKGEDNCNPQNNYERAGRLEPRYYLWQVGVDEGVVVLALTVLKLDQGVLDFDPKHPEPSRFVRKEQ
jgi:hypothetical protein